MGFTYLLYFGTAFIACLCAWFAQKGRDLTLTLFHMKIAGREFLWRVNRASFFMLLGVIPLILLCGLRWETGVDHQNYYWLFTNIHYNIPNHAEVGFYLLSQLVWYFTEDMSVLFFLCAVITGIFTFVAIRQNSGDFSISVFLYIAMGFYFYSMNSIRHFIALSIFLFAYKYLKGKQFWRYLLCILAAACFHKIALVAIPLYFVLNIKWKAYWYAIFASGLLGVALFHRQILDFIYQFVFGFYKDIEVETAGTSYVNILITLALSVLVFLYRQRLLERDHRNIILINGAWMGLLFFVFCGWIPEYTRIGQYLTILALFLVPEIIACEERPKIKRLYLIGLAVGFTAYLALIIWNAQNPLIGWAPYKSVFQRTEYDLIPFWMFPG